MSDYLPKFFPKPFLEDLVKGECLPIIGSGFSLNANIPNGMGLPMWNDLGKLFAEYLVDYNYTTALEAISAYGHEYSRNSLISKLSEFLHTNDISPGDAHKAFAALPFKMVCTTNFDFLLERSYSNCKPIIDESQLSISTEETTTVLLKIHGDLNHPKQLVVTEEDYDLFLERNPLLATYLSYLLIVKTPLFIGYSIDDPDFRLIFKIVNDRLGCTHRPAYSIALNASIHDISKFERRGVKVINIIDKKTNYSKLFTDVFNEMKLLWSKGVLKNSTYTQNDSMVELLSNDIIKTRLCFFSIPFKELANYKDYIFPIVQKYGFVPVTADEVISYGDNILAKINALIQNAEIVICDLSDYNINVKNELDLALSYQMKKILVISDDIHHNKTSINNRNLSYVIKNKDFNIIEAIDLWLREISTDYFDLFNKEPIRLLEKEEYRAAIVSAISLFESEATKYFANRVIVNDNRKISNIRLAQQLLNHEVINSEEYKLLSEWVLLRNHLIHAHGAASKKQATIIVNGIIKILNKLK